MSARILYLAIFLVAISILISPTSQQCPPPNLGISTFIPNRRCPLGGQYQQANPRARCTCVFRCGYRCDPVQGSPTRVPPQTTTTPTTTIAPITTTTACPSTCDLGTNFTQIKPTTTVGTTTPPGSSTTLAGSSTPLAGSSTPLAGSSTPLAGSSTPLAGSSTPLAGSSTPLAGSSTPLAGSSTPLAGSSTTLAGSSTTPPVTTTTAAPATLTCVCQMRGGCTVYVCS